MGKPFDPDRKPPPGCTTITTSAALSPQERAGLANLAESSGRTVSEEMRCAVKHWVDERVGLKPHGDKAASPEGAERPDERPAALGLRPEDLAALEPLINWTGMTAADFARHTLQLYIGSHIDYLVHSGQLREGEWEAPENVRRELGTTELHYTEPRTRPRR